MGKVSLTAVFVWSLVGLAGCSAIAGLDGIQEESCAPNCGDAAMNPPTDSSTQETQADSPQGNDSSSGGDTSMIEDSGMATDTGGGGQDSDGIDTGSITDGPPIDDAPFDSGCGSLNTTTNCGACGAACAAPGTHDESAAFCCTGTTCPGSTNGAGDICKYTCDSDYLDCNAAMTPNNDGCECPTPNAQTTPSCCGSLCPIEHNWDTSMVGTTFYDCSPASMYSFQLAMDACTAYTGDATQCDDGYTFGCLASDGGIAGDSVCSNGPNAHACVCWGYDGQAQGLMIIGPGTFTANMNNCECPINVGSHWN